MGEHQFSTKFFRIMLSGSRKRLKLPPAFCEKVKHEKSERAILESCKGKWEINVRRKDDDQIVLEDGWPRFADEHGLRLGDFLVLEHTGKLHFNVVVYNSTGCEKQFLVVRSNFNDHQTINLIYHAKETAPRRSQRPCFTHKITRFTATNKHSTVTIPKEFVKRNNLWEKKGAILIDPHGGRKWRMKVCGRTSSSFQMTMSGSEWRDFVAANNLEVGDLCTFQLKPIKSPSSENIYFDVHISRNTNC